VSTEVVGIVREILGDAVLGAYLHGSAVLGGLRPTSDIDVLAVIARPTNVDERRAIVDRLLGISGRRAHHRPGRPIELTIVVGSEVKPWRYPPRAEFQYGEWLRNEYEAGRTPEPERSPDLAPIITMARAGNCALFGPPPAHVLDPVPAADLRRAIVAGVPSLLADLDSDTRNVLLTLARVWFTLATGRVGSKDVAADWALARLAADVPGATRATPLRRARRMYLDGQEDEVDTWANLGASVNVLADRLVAQIELCRPAGNGSADAGNQA
jgi:predicted nucleotidyltransferase